ncbi:MAG: hypothetical protein RI909_2226 [Bacteroidota bacterium]|jgi:hypothetical protein
MKLHASYMLLDLEIHILIKSTRILLLASKTDRSKTPGGVDNGVQKFARHSMKYIKLFLSVLCALA